LARRNSQKQRACQWAESRSSSRRGGA